MNQNAFPALEIRRTSTVENVAEALQEAILDGRLAPGSTLRESELAGSFSVSRNTVRAALRLLVDRGLAIHRMHQGVEVVLPDERDVADIYRVRGVLEIDAIECGLENAAGMAALEAAVRQLELAVDGKDRHEIVEADLLFHRRIVGLLGSPRLDQLFANIQVGLRLCLSILSRVDREYLEPAWIAEEHRAIFERARAGSRREASRLLGIHLDTNEARLREIVGKRSRRLREGP